MLARVIRPVDRKFEIAAGIRKVSDDNGPAVLFENVKGFEIPVVGGVFATRRLSMLAMGVDTYSEAVSRFGHGVSNPIQPVHVKSAPCQQVVLKNADIDLTRLPNPIYSEGDSAPYISSGAILTRDPESGVGNVGIYRLEIKGPNTICLEAPEYQHVNVARLRAETLGRGLEIAIAIGADPLIYYASQAKVGYEVDELGIAGGIRGEPIEVTKGVSVDLDIPASSEIVVEGRFIPSKKLMEGPFGEFTGYQTASRPEPVIEVTAITHRQHPIYQAILTGAPTTENHVLKTFGYDWSLYEFLKKQFPEVTAATVPTAGGVQYLSVVALDQTHKGQAKKIMLATLASPIRTKLAIIVDSDIDIYDLEKVMWAVSTHSQPGEDVVIIPKVAGSRIDPSSIEPGIVDLMGIDATRPFGREFPPKVVNPGSETFEF